METENTSENVLIAQDSFPIKNGYKNYISYIIKVPKWFADYCNTKNPIGLTVKIKGT